MLRLAVKFEEMLGVPVDVVPVDEINPQSRIRVFNERFGCLRREGWCLRVFTVGCSR